jgi:hypothetical protein
MKFFCFFLFSFSFLARGAGVDWSGQYRFELINVNNPNLESSSGNKSYGLHFLTLRPRILASDGINIYSRFDILTNRDPDYQNSQLGQLWGGSEYTRARANNGGVNNTSRDQQINTNIAVRELYLKVEEENGALILGRAPYQFGLGIAHNAGLNPFDHWYDNRDMLAYKFFVGNLSLMPMLARSFDEGPSAGRMNQMQALEIMYDNKDSGTAFGVYLERASTSVSNVGSDVNASWRETLCKGGACAASGSYQREHTGFYVGRKWEQVSFRMEGDFLKSDTGVSANAVPIKVDAYALATELDYRNPESKLGYGLRLGLASGDSPSSTNYEGYQFDRNYDVAMLLFNHRLGQRDFLKTDLIKNKSLTARNSFDDEAISNTFYASARLHHDWKERWKLNYSLTFAQLLAKLDSSSDMSRDLGLELDAEIVYSPREKVRWVNQIGFMVPGKAFQNGTGVGGNLGTSTAIGIASKAAISF